MHGLLSRVHVLAFARPPPTSTRGRAFGLITIWNSTPRLHTDPDLRSKVTSLLLRLGIKQILNSLCEGEPSHTVHLEVLWIVMFLFALEPQNQDHPHKHDLSRIVSDSAVSKVMGGNVRDTLKYLHKKAKKASCNCLRPFYLISRAYFPKHGKCQGCCKMMDRKDLMVCVCGATFCSHKCQKMSWPEHKHECKEQVGGEG